MGLLQTPNVKLFLGILVAIILLSLSYYIGSAVATKAPDAPAVVDVAVLKAAYVSETGELVFLSRKDNTVKYVLTKEATTAVFTLKSTDVQKDYLESSGQGKSAPNKGAPAKHQ